MKVVVDNNLPYSLASLLRASGIEASHVIDTKLADADDDVLREHFAEEPIIFLTRDNDFWNNHPPRWSIVWLALHNPKLSEIKGPICKTLSGLLPTLSQGQKVLIATDQIRIFD
jgi:predicted nuclease of predicted toxin-antitoxin system